MAFFRNILNFTREAVQQREQRQSQRYPVGPRFPLRATLAITGGGTPESPGTVTDLSATGANIQLPASVCAVRGEGCRLKLELGSHQLEIGGTVAHLRPGDAHSACGLAFNFANFNEEKSYFQLLAAVVLGASLAPVKAELVRQDAPGQKKEQYRGEDDAQLTVWRDLPAGTISGFEFRMNEFFARGSTLVPVLEVYSQEEMKDDHKLGYSVPALHMLAAESDEIRQLFSWAVPNLAPCVPADTRAFLEKFAV